MKNGTNIGLIKDILVLDQGLSKDDLVKQDQTAMNWHICQSHC